MTPERWRQIEQRYHTALELPPDQRSAFLDQACADDQTLRQEVESLLASSDQAGSFIESPPDDVAAGMMAEEQKRSMTGRSLGHYQITALIGAGGMGEVYRATDTRLNREVAVKILPEHLAANPEAMLRFEREAKAVAALSHPNILAIYDFGTEQGVSYAVMELLEGESLRECLRRAPLGWRQAVEISLAMAEGLAAAHARGIIHRDLKPENIFLTKDGQVKILDFGIARVKHEVSDEAKTMPSTATGATKPGQVVGTFGYMSPEQVRGEVVEAPSDIFSFGCVLYEMVSGERPFAREAIAETMAAILRDDPPALTGTEKGVPEEGDHVVRHCLEKRASERYQSARDLAFDLKAVLGKSGSARAVAAAARPRARTAVWMVAVAALLLGVIAWWWLSEKVIDSLAVLPLVNASEDADLEYLSDGMTESIINSLSQLPKLRVMARSTVFSYKGKEVDPRQVGRELHVRAVLTGKLAQRGDDLTISVELVNAADGSRLWGEQYQQKLVNVMAVQGEIAKQISEKLRIAVTGEQQQRLTKRYTENTEAYRFYLMGRHHLSEYTEEGFNKGLDCFKQALNLDPNYTLAYAGEADAYYWLSNLYLPPNEAMPKSRAAARTALQQDETLAEAHASLAVVKALYDWDWAGAEREYKRALELNPGYAPAHHMYGLYFMATGQPDAALAELKRAQELDPLSLSIAVTALWPFHYVSPPARQPDRAIEELRKIIALDPKFHPAYNLLGCVYEQKGMYEEAIIEYNRAKQLDNSTGLLASLGHAYALADKKGEAKKVLSELQERSKREHVAAYSMATVYIGLGEKDQAFAWLQKASEDRDEGLAYLKVDPTFDSLRSDPRFTALLRRMGLTP